MVRSKMILYLIDEINHSSASLVYPGWVNQTFSTIIENTVFYDNELCNKNDLEFFLKIKT